MAEITETHCKLPPKSSHWNSVPLLRNKLLSLECPFQLLALCRTQLSSEDTMSSVAFSPMPNTLRATKHARIFLMTQCHFQVIVLPLKQLSLLPWCSDHLAIAYTTLYFFLLKYQSIYVFKDWQVADSFILYSMFYHPWWPLVFSIPVLRYSPMAMVFTSIPLLPSTPGATTQNLSAPNTLPPE